MCLVIVAWQVHPDYPVIFATNRDEFFSRASEEMKFREQEKVYAGLDLKSGGYWCGVSLYGQWGIVTNYREAIPQAANAPSRGILLRDYLHRSKRTENLQLELHRFPGVNLLLGDLENLYYLSNRAESRKLEPGLYVLSNGILGEPWFKVRRSRESAKQLLAEGKTELSDWLRLLQDETKAPPTEKLPQTGFGDEVEWFLSSAFIRSADYGTRVSTLARRDCAGNWQLREISYNNGQKSVEFAFKEMMSL